MQTHVKTTVCCRMRNARKTCGFQLFLYWLEKFMICISFQLDDRAACKPWMSLEPVICSKGICHYDSIEFLPVVNDGRIGELLRIPVSQRCCFSERSLKAGPSPSSAVSLPLAFYNPFTVVSLSSSVVWSYRIPVDGSFQPHITRTNWAPFRLWIFWTTS